MKKKLIIALLLVSNGPWMMIANSEEHKPLRLKSDIIHLMDGMSVAIDGIVYGLILQVRRELRKLLFGIQNNHGILEGIYEFRGKLYSLITLAQLESEIDAKYFAQEDAYMHNTGLFTSVEWQQIEHNYKTIKDELAVLLKQVKEEFKEVTKAYLEGARGAKDQMLILIEESCTLRNNPNCFLLRWGETKEGQESVILDNEVMNFKELCTFFHDLVHFLEDLANSCPKAREQFLAMVRAHKK